MFSIYGISGQVFSGTLEEMNRVRAANRTRAVRAIAEDGEELGIEALTGMAAGSREAAVRAYRSMLPRDLERGPLYHASQIMQTNVIRLNADDSVTQAWRSLRDHGIHQAPVLDENGRLVGIVSERDLLTAINVDGGRIVESLGRRVRDVMTSPVVATAPITDIRRIASVMIDHGLDGVPIIGETGRLLGFVSRGDILRAVVTDPPLSLWR
ncbi:MAG: CBS domain-containing protein [Rhodocyclales bacterium]|nr:CBS domain-containing protein [Rhodocyclales bacterium]